MSDPAGEASDREQYCEHPRREAHRLIDDSRVEVDVGIELAFDEVVVGERHRFELFGDIEQVVLDAKSGQNLVGTLFDEAGTGIEVLVHAVPKTHEPYAVFFVLDAFDEGLDALPRGLDVAEHGQDRFVGTTVQGTVQRVDSGRHGGEDVGLGGSNETHRGGGGVLFVVFVQNQQTVKRPRQDRVNFVRFRHCAKVQFEEVVDKAQPVVRVEERLAEALFVRVCRDDGELSQQAHDRHFDLLRIADAERALVVGRERRDGAGEHRHGVRAVRESVEEATQVFVKQGVATNLVIELC